MSQCMLIMSQQFLGVYTILYYTKLKGSKLIPIIRIDLAVDK